MHRPVPAGAHDVCYALSVDPIILVQLHAESPFRMAGINANDIEGTGAKFMHQPSRHGTRLQADHGVFRVLKCDRFWRKVNWPRKTLRPCLTTMQIAVDFCETSNPTNAAIVPSSAANWRAYL